THADADRVFEAGVLEVVERVAEVIEGGDAEVARQIAHDFDAAREQMLAAHALLFLADFRRQLVQAEAAHAALAARKEALRGGQLGEIRDAAYAQLAAQVQVPQIRHVEDAFAL